MKNQLRAKRAEIVIVLFEQLYGEKSVAELICDVTHWCDCNDQQLSEALKSAWYSYHGDTDGEGRQFRSAIRWRSIWKIWKLRKSMSSFHL